MKNKPLTKLPYICPLNIKNQPEVYDKIATCLYIPLTVSIILWKIFRNL